MMWAPRNIILSLKLLIAALLLALVLIASGCWDDTCPEGCDVGYACYYGVCLSRGFCDVDDPHATTCAEEDSETGECLHVVDHGICRNDRSGSYVCVCKRLDSTSDRCLERRCELSTE